MQIHVCNLKNCKEISKQNNDKYQSSKNSSPEKSVCNPTPLPLNSSVNVPSPNRINRATIATFIGAVISYNFASYLLYHFSISGFKHAPVKILKILILKNFPIKRKISPHMHKKVLLKGHCHKDFAFLFQFCD